MSKVIVIAPHPDDETLGCGGTLLKHKNRGDEIYWLIVTNIFSNDGNTKEQVDSRQQEIKNVEKEFGFNKVFKLDFPTTNLDSIPMKELVQSISDIIDEVRPEIVILPFKSDVHSDHRIVFETAYACTKAFRIPSIKRVLIMEILSETEFAPADNSFSPNYFVDISGYLDKKLNIMNIYKGEIGTHPFPRSRESVKALATLRGVQSGCEFAEAFMSLKDIN